MVGKHSYLNYAIILMRNSRKIAIAVVFAVFVVVAAAEANNSWGGFHWARKSNPFTLKLGDNVSPAWDSYLGTTSADWSVSKVLDTTIVTGSGCKPTSGRTEVCSAAYGNTGWLGLAQIWINKSKHITKALAKVNDTYFNTETYNTPAWRNLVMCQEVAHTTGLDHQDETFENTNLGTCMDYTNDPDGTGKNQLSNEHPNKHDYDQLAAIYAHLDSGTTLANSVQRAAQAGNNGDFENSSEWGRGLRQDGHGRTSLYELDLGNGNKVFTFVFWANEE